MSLIDDLKTPKPWNWGTPANGVTMYSETVKPLDDNIRLVASAVDNLPQPSEQVQANWNTSASSDPSFIQNKPTIPTKTSQLQNDAGFITSSDIPSVPTKTSDLQNDSGFITSADVPSASKIQSNWACNDEDDPSFIQNKPGVVGAVQSDWDVPHSATDNPACILNKPETPEEWNAAGAAPYYHASRGINYGISYYNNTNDFKYGHVLSLPGFDFDSNNWSAYSGAGLAWVGGPNHTHSKLRIAQRGYVQHDFPEYSLNSNKADDAEYNWSIRSMSGDDTPNNFAGITVYDLQFTMTKYQNSGSQNILPLQFTLWTFNDNAVVGAPIALRSAIIANYGNNGEFTVHLQGIQGEDYEDRKPTKISLEVYWPRGMLVEGDAFSAHCERRCYGNIQKKGTQLSPYPG